MDPFDDGVIEESPADGDGLPVSEAGPGQRDRLVKHIAGGDEATCALVQRNPDTTMIRISRVDVGEPSTRIDENAPVGHVRLFRPYSHRS